MSRRFLLAICFAMLSCFCFAQDGSATIFKGLKVRFGFTGSYSHQFTKDWKYILHQDSKFHLERERPDNGVPLSVVFLFPTDKDEIFNILLNVSFADVATGKNVFNSRVPFGVGAAVFPWPDGGAKIFGFTLFGGFGTAYKMRQSAYDDPSVVFPIAHHPGYNLMVGSPIAEEVIKPFCTPKTTYSLNAGFVIRLVY